MKSRWKQEGSDNFPGRVGRKCTVDTFNSIRCIGQRQWKTRRCPLLGNWETASGNWTTRRRNRSNCSQAAPSGKRRSHSGVNRPPLCSATAPPAENEPKPSEHIFGPSFSLSLSFFLSFFFSFVSNTKENHIFNYPHHKSTINVIYYSQIDHPSL